MQFNVSSDNNKNINNFNDNKSVNNEVQRITDISLRETSKLGLDQEMVGKYISSDYNIDLSPFVGRYFGSPRSSGRHQRQDIQWRRW